MEVTGTEVAGAAAGSPECLCQQWPLSLTVTASEQRSLTSGRQTPLNSHVEPCCTCCSQRGSQQGHCPPAVVGAAVLVVGREAVVAGAPVVGAAVA